MRRFLSEMGFGDWAMVGILLSGVAAVPAIFELLRSDATVPWLILFAGVGFLYTMGPCPVLLFTNKRERLARTLAWGFLSGGAFFNSLSYFVAIFGEPTYLAGENQISGLPTFYAGAVSWLAISVGAWLQSWRSARGLEERHGRRQ